MTTPGPPQAPSWRSASVPGPGVWVSLAVALAFVVSVACLSHYRNVFEFDPDESNNLIKSLLVDRGFALGSEIWTDQPPFFTTLLRGWLQVAGWSVARARELVLLFSGLTVFALHDSLRRLGGQRHALAASLLLVSSAAYIPLSVSAMIGLPAIAWLALSVWALIFARTPATASDAHQANPRALAVLYAGSGAALGFSLTTKLFTAFLAPVLVLLVLSWSLWAWRRKQQRAWVAPAFFLGALAASLIVGAWPLLAAQTWGGLIETHEKARESRGGGFDGWGTVVRFFRDDWLLYALAPTGLVWAAIRRRHLMHLWSVWLLVGLFCLADHYPVWPHHRLLLAVPAAALAGFSIGETLGLAGRLLPRGLLARLQARPRMQLILGGLACLLAAGPGVAVFASADARWAHAVAPPTWSSSDKDWKIYEHFAVYAEGSDMVAAARPIYAFRAARPLPPDLAVTSWKRFKGGFLTAKTVTRQIKKFKPQAVLLSSRWPATVRRELSKQLEKTHCRLAHWPHQTTELWVERNLAQRTALRADAKALATCLRAR